MSKTKTEDPNKMIHAMGKYNGYSHNKDRTKFQLAPMHIKRIEAYFEMLDAYNELVLAHNTALLKLSEQRTKIQSDIIKYIKEDLSLSIDEKFNFSRYGEVNIFKSEKKDETYS